MPDKTERNPWTQLSRTEIYNNEWICVNEDAVTRPDGKPGTYSVVHFKRAATAIVPIDADGFTWLVGQFRYPLDSYSWETPQGGSDPGESPLQAAARELQEETGIQAKAFELVRTVHLSNCITDEVGYVYIATELTLGQANPDGTEELALRRCHLDDALELVHNNEITDALSVIGLMQAELWWRNK